MKRKAKLKGKKVLVKSGKEGVWFGEVEDQFNTEVILINAHKLTYWSSAGAIGLKGAARFGIVGDRCMIEPRTKKVWLNELEIFPCTALAVKNIEAFSKTTFP